MIKSMDRLPHIDHLVWDDWNREHLTKHDVTPDEAVQVIAGDPSRPASRKERAAYVQQKGESTP